MKESDRRTDGRTDGRASELWSVIVKHVVDVRRKLSRVMACVVLYVSFVALSLTLTAE